MWVHVLYDDLNSLNTFFMKWNEVWSGPGLYEIMVSYRPMRAGHCYMRDKIIYSQWCWRAHLPCTILSFSFSLSLSLKAITQFKMTELTGTCNSPPHNHAVLLACWRNSALLQQLPTTERCRGKGEIVLNTQEFWEPHFCHLNFTKYLLSSRDSCLPSRPHKQNSH